MASSWPSTPSSPKSVGVQHQARTGRKPSDRFIVNPAVWQPGSVNSVGRAV
jgi:hypothetical protein